MIDKRTATAIHEAGHVVVALALGVGARAWLGECPFDDDAAPEDVPGCPGMANFCDWTPEQARVIAFGGVIAEALAADPETTAGELVGQIARGELDPSNDDWNSARLTRAEFRAEPDRQAVERAVAALRSHPALFSACVDALLRDGSVCCVDPLEAIRSQSPLQQTSAPSA